MDTIEISTELFTWRGNFGSAEDSELPRFEGGTFWLKSHKTGDRRLMHLRHTERDAELDTRWWEFSTLVGAEVRVTIFND